MVSRQQHTAMAKDTPVRLYKIIAVSFLLLTLVLLGVIVFMSSKRATITITSKGEPVEMNQTVLVGGENGKDMIAGIVTSTAVAAEETYQPLGNKEIDGRAEGVVTIHNETAFDQSLVATTRLLTTEGVLFRLKERVTVPANGTVDALVHADTVGKEGDVPPSKFTIPGLNPAKQSLIYATSDAPMHGGVKKVGAVSADDMTRAEKMLREALQKAGETALRGAYQDKEGLFSIVNVTMTSDTDVGSEVSEFRLTGAAAAVGVFYDTEEVDAWAKGRLLSRAVGDAEVITPRSDPPTVSLESYDLEKGTAKVVVVYSGLASLNPKSKQLEKAMFFGKTKDEVRRYVLSLDHVHGVDIHFRPAWMMTVPHVADHVDVVVKQVE